jgi:hypothetical protein
VNTANRQNFRPRELIQDLFAQVRREGEKFFFRENLARDKRGYATASFHFTAQLKRTTERRRERKRVFPSLDLFNHHFQFVPFDLSSSRDAKRCSAEGNLTPSISKLIPKAVQDAVEQQKLIYLKLLR